MPTIHPSHLKWHIWHIRKGHMRILGRKLPGRIIQTGSFCSLSFHSFFHMIISCFSIFNPSTTCCLVVTSSSFFLYPIARSGTWNWCSRLFMIWIELALCCERIGCLFGQKWDRYRQPGKLLWQALPLMNNKRDLVRTLFIISVRGSHAELRWNRCSSK